MGYSGEFNVITRVLISGRWRQKEIQREGRMNTSHPGIAGFKNGRMIPRAGVLVVSRTEKGKELDYLLELWESSTFLLTLQFQPIETNFMLLTFKNVR